VIPGEGGEGGVDQDEAIVGGDEEMFPGRGGSATSDTFEFVFDQ
jgi:hypothetical protein